MSMSIQYQMKKRAQKMAKGGMCEHGSTMCEMCHGGKMMAEGGMMEDEDMISRIMKKRAGHYSEGGRVANEDHDEADFKENEFDDLPLDDHLEEHYTGSNSGDELGNEQEDEDERDVVARIMRSRGKKDRMPRPA